MRPVATQLGAALGDLLEGQGAADPAASMMQPMIRAAARCLAARPVPAIRDDGAAPFVEYVLVFDDEVIVVESGRRDPRLALVVACDREPNLALVQQACRVAIAAIEDTVDLAAWGMAS